MRALLAVLAAAAALAGCGDKDEPRPTPTPTATATPAETPLATTGPPGQLAIGITEQNPNFVWPAEAKPQPEPFSRWRDALQRLRPHFYRLVIDWPSLQPEQDAPPSLDIPNGGCLRDRQPCASYAGVREQLQALGAAQKAAPGRWQTLVVITGTPEWAAEPPHGCERGGTQPRSRAPRADAMPAYEALIATLLDAADTEQAQLRYWSAWNEPNHPYFISPQRARCDAGARSVVARPYTRLARALKQALDRAPGDQELVIGELAGLEERRPYSTTVPELVRALPDDVVCASTIWSQHGYVGGPDLSGPALRALERRGCPQRHEAWITETGVGAPRQGRERPRGSRRECRQLRRRLERWHADDRVTAAFQYTLREDNLFPTGLVSTDLARAYPVLDEWLAWGGEREPAAPPGPPGCR